MKIEYHKYYSKHLNKEMEFKVYGHTGKPVLVFPCHGGRFYEWEDFRMFDVLYPFTESGEYQFFTVDSVFGEAWSNDEWDIPTRAYHHKLYEKYIIEELLPIIKKINPSLKLLATGFSMGGYHATILSFRYPQIFDELICLSGVLTLNLYIGDYYDKDIEEYTPVHYIRTLNDRKKLYQLKENKLIFSGGQGQWEEETIADYKLINYHLFEKKIPAWIDLWGFDVSHDWPWWKQQLPYYLGKLTELRQ
ncbi:MAG TPA: alpha/beta hydrolase-fold protein [Ignavibacteriales bacterium]|nr:alpha/beta hydrolase-fold protein [Ignavibacteriales bacterium]HOL81825.1 alpha/beta hydrolase-fold protein [Ignavibacteriales bacterium]HOM65799.1 alpha/beta hydrolase-fold protein [Ignavibacteriales bacterium]HPD67098.1 alpha/beta hydrolase-fold protein [Ignavibacteriales bacterium]HPP33962.1 alpha/beta hydrolase-fold protein [Ignavibacteriales bacterium]